MADHKWTRPPKSLAGFLFALLIVGASSCGGGSRSGGSTITTPHSSLNEWTWMGGTHTDTGVPNGTYGTLGVPSTANIPGARSGAVSWIDASGNFWLFGGQQLASDDGDLNDLWMYSPTDKTWTWVSGSDTTGASGVYGTLGVASAANVPGVREGSASWTDKAGNLWMFGGFAYYANGRTAGRLNDLWKFSTTTKVWTWVGGSSVLGATGVYGTLGVPSGTNVPGSRDYAASWTDSNGNFWLFGGVDTGEYQYLNDLWMYSPSNGTWTWVSGSDTAGASGVYGTLGTPSATNVPDGRFRSSSWVDGNGNLWLFGGVYEDPDKFAEALNDLWEFNPTTKTWTWVSGSNTPNAQGVYGTLNTASAANVPGARAGAVSWTDGSGNLWLFGGNGMNGDLSSDLFNDLWEFSPSTKTWTWVSGSNTPNAQGIYGTLNAASAANVPGARAGAVSWTDGSGNFWLFGGHYNDLWEYTP